MELIYRSSSWLDTEIFDLLNEKECSLCIADTDELPAYEIVSTAPWGYLRLILSQKWQRAYVFNVGSKYVCKDGPVFTLRQIKQMHENVLS